MLPGIRSIARCEFGRSGCRGDRQPAGPRPNFHVTRYRRAAGTPGLGWSRPPLPRLLRGPGFSWPEVRLRPALRSHHSRPAGLTADQTDQRGWEQKLSPLLRGHSPLKQPPRQGSRYSGGKSSSVRDRSSAGPGSVVPLKRTLGLICNKRAISSGGMPWRSCTTSWPSWNIRSSL